MHIRIVGQPVAKILNPDGSYAPESKRSVPTIWAALTKLLGLHSIFPKSRLFGQYYLSWLSEDQQAKVPVLSGSFMFWRTELLQQLEGFDERFFMYGEDIDLCYRVQQTNYHIDYVPTTSIIHYKGESTKKGIYATFEFSMRRCIYSLISIIPLDIASYSKQ